MSITNRWQVTRRWQIGDSRETDDRRPDDGSGDVVAGKANEKER